MFQRKYRHSPVRKEGCFRCHSSGSDPPYAVQESLEELCYGCHAELKKSLDDRFVHGPFAGGFCDACHDPHGSDVPGALRTSAGDLCLGCHEDLEQELSKPQLHLPFEKNDCLRCHEPHSSDQAVGLVESPVFLCERCHRIKEGTVEHRHPSNVKPSTDYGKRLPVLLDKKLVCISCHSPHASEVDALLKTTAEQGCNGCHPK